MIYQLPVPKSSQIFESIICDLLNSLYKTTSFNLYGRNGQSQKGIDIISYERLIVAQCKLRTLNIKDRKTKISFINEIISDINSIIKLEKNPEKIIIATTIENDTLIQDQLNTITLLNGIPIIIEYWSWDYISNNLFLFNHIVNKYYPYRNNNIELANLRVLNKTVYVKSKEHERLYYFKNIKNRNQLPVFDIMFINNSENTIILNTIDVYSQILTIAKAGHFDKPSGILKVTKKFNLKLNYGEVATQEGKSTIELNNPLYAYPKAPFRIQIQTTKPINIYLKVRLAFNFNSDIVISPEIFFNSDYALSGKIIQYI